MIVFTFIIFISTSSSLVFAADDFNYIQYEIDSGQSNINLNDKTYTPGTVATINLNKDNITIKGKSSDSKAVLNNYGGNSTIMIISGNNTRLENLIFTNVNLNLMAGAISFKGSNLTIINCEFKTNKGAYGAIVLEESSRNAIIKDCIFIDNIATYSSPYGGLGGAINSFSSNTQIITCIFINNYAEKGGGSLYFRTGSNNVILECGFLNNKAPNGGAIWVDSTSNGLKITRSYFINNTANIHGGAIYNNADLTITASDFTNNKAGNNGGSIYTESSKPTNINEATKFINNTAKNGGAVYSNSIIYVKSSEFLSNYASDSGGALYLIKATNIQKGIFSGNIAFKNGGGIFSLNNVLANGCQFSRNVADYGSGIFSKSSLNIYSSVFSNNKAGCNLNIQLIDNIIKYGYSKIKINLVAHDNVRVSGADYSIYHSGSNKLVTINGKGISKSTVLSSYAIKINGIYVKTNSKSEAFLNIKTSPTYKWNNYVFTASFSGNSLYKNINSVLTVKAIILKTDSYNIQNKKNKYYLPYRKDTLETFNYNTQKSFKKTIYQKANYNIYFLGGEKAPSSIQKYLKGNWVCQVNHSTIKKQIIKILKDKKYKMSGLITPKKKSNIIYEWVKKNTKYGVNSDYDAVTVLKRIYNKKITKDANCAGHSNLLIAMFRTGGIPSSYFYFKPVGYDYHVYSLAYVYTNGAWKKYKADAVGKNWKFGYTNWKVEKDDEELEFPHWY